MGSHHELFVEISVYGISFHVVEASGVLLINFNEKRQEKTKKRQEIGGVGKFNKSQELPR